MPSYTYAPAVVLNDVTGEFAIGANGVLRPDNSGAPVQIYDLNGSPLAAVKVGTKGAHQAFMADIPQGILDFGSVQIPSISQEAITAALNVQVSAAAAASAAQASAASAKTAADTIGSAATTTAKGVVELATVDEAKAGTDTTRAITAAGLKAVADTKAATDHTHAGGTTGGATTSSTLVRPEDFVSTAGTGADDTNAINQAIAALTPGRTLHLTTGRVYRHSNVLRIIANNVTISGGGTLLATNATNSVLRIEGSGVTLEHFTKEKPSTAGRLDAYESQNILAYGATDLSIFGVTSKGGTGTGFFLTRVVGFRAEHARAINTLADGFHITGGSTDGYVADFYGKDVGDDGVACVGYVGGSDPGLVRRVHVLRPSIYTAKAGRGVSALGCDDVTYQDIYTADTFAAGALIANETYGNNPIHPATNVKILGGQIHRANTNFDPAGVGAPVDHGAVLVSSQRAGIANKGIVIEGLDIYDTRAAAPWEVGVLAGGGNNEDVLIRNLRFHGRAGNTWYGAGWNGGVNTNVRRHTPWDKYNAVAATAA